MKQPQRLADAGADEFERGLLSSSSADAPSEQAFQRTLTSLGVGLLVPLASAGVAHGAGAAAVATGSKLGVAALGKWLATGMAIGAVTVSAVTVTERALSTPPAAVTPTTPAPAGVATSTPVEKAGARGAAAVTRASAVEAAKAPEAAAPKHRTETTTPSVEPAASAPSVEGGASVPAEPLAAAPSIKRETELIGSAQRALQRGDTRSALAALERYRSEFPAGVLAPEARLLEISSLLRAGERGRAETLAGAIIARDPAGQEAARARALLAKSK
jgi:hypothetical protein